MEDQQDFTNFEDAAKALGITKEELEWALEEYGRCDTEDKVAWEPSEENGEEWPTAEAP